MSKSKKPRAQKAIKPPHASPDSSAVVSRPDGNRPSSALPRLKLVHRSGRADVIVIYHGTKQISTGTADHEVAYRMFSEYMQGHLDERARPYCDNPVLSTIIEDFSSNLENRYDPELAHRRRVICARLELFFRGKRLYDINEESCRAYIDHLMEPSQDRKPLSSTTIRNDLKLLKMIVTEFCDRHGLIAVPTFFLPEANIPRREFLTRSEVRRLLGTIRRKRSKRIRYIKVCTDGEDRSKQVPHPEITDALSRFVLIGTYTGIRCTPLLKLRWDANDEGGHIDFDDGILYQISGGDAVTNKNYPPVKIIPSLLRLLRRWRDLDRLSGFWGYVIHDAPGEAIADKTMRHLLSKAGDQAGLDKNVSPHLFRHTCATWLAEGDAPPDEAAAFLGHTVREYEKTYAEVEPRFSMEASLALADWGRPDRQPVPHDKGTRKASI